MGNQWRPDDTPSQPTALMVDMMAIPCETIQHLLGPQGPIAQDMPKWEERLEQMQVSQVIRRALKQRRDALIEAGCGTGKTNAYLTPAVLHALENKQQVIISTHSIALQDQLANKDLPFLQRALELYLRERFGRGLKWAILKGRQNSICEAKYARATDLEPYIQEWHDETLDGDLGSLVLTPQQRARLTAASEECAGSRCSYADVCWWLHSRARARQADVVVVNHALLVQLLQQEGFPYDAVIVDEAHELADVIREALGIRVSPKGVQQLVKQAEKFAGTVAEGIPHELSRLLATLQHSHRNNADEGTALLDPDRDLAGTAAENHLVELLEQVGRLSREVKEVDTLPETEEDARKNKLVAALDRLATELTSLRIGRAGRISWLELADGASLRAEPVDVSSWLRERTKVPIVLSSATLATGTGNDAFGYVSETLGVRSLHQKIVDSPFNWEQQAWIYLPTRTNEHGDVVSGIPESALAMGVKDPHERMKCNKEYARVATMFAREFFRVTKGRGLWLFTARQDMLLVAELLRQEFPCPFLVQGEMGNQEALQWLRETGGVLLGLAGLSQGVDIQGDALSALVIHKLPFPPPSDLVHEARLERAGGGKSAGWRGRERAFQQLSVPYAITKTKQAFGRLIRTSTDRGVAMLLDPRLRGKHSAILQALPPAKIVTREQLLYRGGERTRFWLAAAGEPVPGDPVVAEALQRLHAANVVDLTDHRQYLARMVARLPLLPPGLWTAAKWLCERYQALQNVSETEAKRNG